MCYSCSVTFFFFNDTATTEIYTLSLHDALPISGRSLKTRRRRLLLRRTCAGSNRSEEHTSELQSHVNLVCRLLLEKKKTLQCGRNRRWVCLGALSLAVCLTCV